jgi:hypothetical protein
MVYPNVIELVRAGNLRVVQGRLAGAGRRPPVATRPAQPVVRPARTPRGVV